ncbi:MAG: type II toxin-antitoxin system RelB/DinJ family antitoxin [Epsilonproteobacteria bacterium]|nr:type II toxin-antitoxin system RelB/DinJ family antitoxin [Campylobacterota bacterium]
MAAEKVSIYIDKDIKERAQKLFSSIDISLNEAINLFLAKSVSNNKIPFNIELPNEETKQAIQEARAGKNMEKISIEKLKEEMKQCLK